MLTVTPAKISLQTFLMMTGTLALVITPGCSTTSVPVATNSPTVSHGSSCTSCSSGACEIPPVGGQSCSVEGCGTAACGSQCCGLDGCGPGCAPACGTGCGPGGICLTGGCDVPRELNKASFAEYRIEPPDILVIESLHNLRPANDPILSGEVLLVQADRTLPTVAATDRVAQNFKSINGPYLIAADGYLNLGPEYGKVLVADQPLPEIQRRVQMHLNRILRDPQVLVTLPDPGAKQIVAGPHLVRQDGTVGLGIYGGVFVAGMTIREAKAAIESHLSNHMHNPVVSVDVQSYNSKFYYVIADGGGAGEQVHRIPATGNETVLDAISRIRGLPTVANRGQIWIARPTNSCDGLDRVLHVDWDAIAQGGQVCTNYQLFPGDRLYVKADRWIAFDTRLAKFTAPLERIVGLITLGTFASNNNN